jgi:hypothetical protein
MKLIFSALLLLNATIQASAQDWSTDTYQYDEMYPGYVIKADGEKIAGFIKYRNRMSMQDEIVFFMDKTNPRSKETYRPQELLEYEVAEKHYDCLKYSGSALNNDTKALLLVRSGCINEYAWYQRSDQYNKLVKGEGESDEDYAERKYPITTVYHQEEQIPIDLDYFKDDYAKKMSQYLSNSKELSSRVKKEKAEYSEFKAKALVAEYNKNCN